eukprot:Nk52_evm2s2175 gene=Nk52_evmTU2s2175
MEENNSNNNSTTTPLSHPIENTLHERVLVRQAGGWAAVSSLFQDFGKSPTRGLYTAVEGPPEEWAEVGQGMTIAAGTGFLVGGFIGARKEGERHVMLNKDTLYRNQLQAQREVNYATTRGMLKTGGLYAAKLGGIMGMFMGCGKLIETYRAKDDFLNLSASGLICGGLLGLRGGGILGVARGMAFGLIVAAPLSATLQGLRYLERTLEPEAERLEREREKNNRFARDQQLREQKRNVTTDLIKGLENQLDNVPEVERLDGTV